jgi:hypothetical protein
MFGDFVLYLMLLERSFGGFKMTNFYILINLQQTLTFMVKL